MKRRPLTAKEFLEQLEADPEYQRRTREHEAKMALIAARHAKDQASLVRELADAGIEIESVYDFVNTAAEYPEALPVLIRHLDIPHEVRIREGIIRALTIKYGGAPLEDALLRHFYSEANSGLRWVLANALKVAMPLARRKKHPEIKAVFERSKPPNKSPEPTTMAVTSRAPSSTSRASHGRGSS